ncbi:MAG: alpha/beta fold hydrolase [Acidimicrobiales bacterium]
MQYQFGGFTLDTTSYELFAGDDPVNVEPQVFDVITVLLEHHGQLVTKEAILDSVWGDRFVSESALTTRIKAARQALGDDGSRQEVIATVHGRGYKLVADVEVGDDGSAEAIADIEPPSQRIHLCTAGDGVRIAYATVGCGPPLVKAAHWITHLDYDWHSPVWRHWLDGLSRHRTLVRYDERGCGLSDHDVEDWSHDAWVRDLATVVDELGLERFPILGVSQGGSVAVKYAALNPDRVSHLILLNTFLEGSMVRATSETDIEQAQLYVEMARLGWGRDDPAFRQIFASEFMPDSPELWSAFCELLRRTTPARNAAELMREWATADVTELAEQLDVPTLILHVRDDMRVPFDQGLLAASKIKGSRLVPLEGRNHLFSPTEPAWGRVLDEIDEFLGDA